MSGNGDETQPQTHIDEDGPTIVEGGPLDCQDCGKHQGRQLSAGFMKAEQGKRFVAALCPDCMVFRLGLEWREMKKASILVPGGSGEQLVS